MTLAQSNLLLLMVAAIWGGSFVVQKMAMDLMDPFIYNAMRFSLAALCLLPIRYLRRGDLAIMESSDKRHMMLSTLAAGSIMFFAVAFQQVGLKDTTVSNAGFITGLYIVIVPVLGIFLGHRYKKGIWVAIAIACTGLYLFSGMEGLYMQKGDFFILISAFFWGCHLLVIDQVSHRHHPIAFAIRQFAVCAILSLFAGILTGEKLLITSAEEWTLIIASGVIAIGLGYTLQIYGQKVTPPSQAALIFNTEALFAATAGFIFLDEILGSKAIIGCALIMIGTIMAQFYPPLNHKAMEQKSLP